MLPCFGFLFLNLLTVVVFPQQRSHSFLQNYHTGRSFVLVESHRAQNLQQQFSKRADSTGTALQPLKTKSPKAALWRAIFLPGWGQVYNEKYKKAAFVFGLESFFILRAVDFNQQKQSIYDKDEREKLDRRRNDEVWRLLVTRLLSVLDAYVDAHLFGFDESPDVGLIVDPATRIRGGGVLSLKWNW